MQLWFVCLCVVNLQESTSLQVISDILFLPQKTFINITLVMKLYISFLLTCFLRQPLVFFFNLHVSRFPLSKTRKKAGTWWENIWNHIGGSEPLTLNPECTFSFSWVLGSCLTNSNTNNNTEQKRSLIFSLSLLMTQKHSLSRSVFSSSRFLGFICLELIIKSRYQQHKATWLFPARNWGEISGNNILHLCHEDTSELCALADPTSLEIVSSIVTWFAVLSSALRHAERLEELLFISSDGIRLMRGWHCNETQTGTKRKKNTPWQLNYFEAFESFVFAAELLNLFSWILRNFRLKRAWKFSLSPQFVLNS